MQVLIIDNDIAYRNGVSMAASNKHWIPVSCGDIRTAKQIISSTLPDLIISDCLSPYIKLYDDFQPDGETMEYSYDGNITDGYIPTPENERWEYVSQEMEAYLVSECEMSHEDAQKQMDEVLSKGWTVQEIRQFFIDEYGIVGFQSVWNMSAYKKADAGEVQQYLDSVFQEESYTSYLGRKYADYLGITSILFTISVFAILLI